MKLVHRMERLEDASTEAVYWHWAQRLAEEWGRPAEQVFHHLLEIHERIERDGLDAEIHRIASESGHSEEKVREDFEEALATLPKLGEG